MRLGLGLSLANRVGGGISPIPPAGLSLWLKADAGVTIDGNDETAVAEWADQSGNGNNAISPTTLPTFISSSINSKPAISFNDDGSWMQVPENSIGNDGNISIFVVMNYVNGLVIFNKGDATTYGATVWEITTTNGFGFVNDDGEVFSWNTVPVSPATNTPLLLEGFSSAGVSQLAFNGTNSGAPSGANVGFNNISQYIGIGGGGTNGQNQDPLNARIAEIIIYDRQVTTPERQQVEAYLMDKYAIDAIGGLGSDDPANAAEPDATASLLIDGPFYNTTGDPASGFIGGQSWRRMLRTTHVNGRPAYYYGAELVSWTGSQWQYEGNNTGVFSTSSSNVAYPWLATAWTNNYSVAKVTPTYVKPSMYPGVP